MAVYLITGCAGFIGARVTELLLHCGHSVKGIDNLNDAYDVRLKQWRLKQLVAKPAFEFYQQDICDRVGVEKVFAGRADGCKNCGEAVPQFDAVINLAARAGVRQSVDDPWIYVDANVTGTLNLLELCREYGVPKFVLASSSSVYGTENPMPYQEGADTNHPVSPYAATKKAAEVLCYSYHALYGLDVTVFRLFTV
jgi:UDP-glucuronate 4-epimerase